jgi:putative ABC transport system permease protein
MSYALSTLWYERQRYLPAVLAVAFSCLLIALQCGLLLGLFSITSIPIDKSSADIWVGHPDVPSVDLGIPIPEAWQSYMALPEVERTEPYMEGFAYWKKPTGGMELVLVIGTRLGPDSIGAIKELTPELRSLLSLPNTVVIDETEFERLGITKVGDTAEILGKRVLVVGTVTGLRSLAGPYLFCSLETARSFLRPPPEQCSFLLAKCHDKKDAASVVEKLKVHDRKLSPFTAEEFSKHSQKHWLFKTKAGIALGLAALLGLAVGAVVTATTLHSATAASLKEYAVLRALGIPRWRMAMMVVSQSFWVGITGVTLAIPATFVIAWIAGISGAANILLPPWLLIGSSVITMTMAMLAGLAALRSLSSVEPVTLLR